MIEKKIIICNKLGLHARSAAKIVSITSAFSASCSVTYKDKEANAKSIMELLMLAAKKGEHILVRCEGEDENEAFAQIKALIDNRFDEAE